MPRSPARAGKGKGTLPASATPDLSHIAEELRPLARSVADLSVDTRNPKRHDRRSIDALKASFERFGQIQPIAANVDGVVMAGNGRLKAAQELGWKHIAVVMLTGSAHDARMYAIADNRTAELGSVDHAQLAELMQELGEAGADLNGLGFNASEVEALVDIDETLQQEAPASDDALEGLDVDEPTAVPDPPAKRKGRQEAASPATVADPKDPWRVIGFNAEQLASVRTAMDLLRKEKNIPDLTLVEALTVLARRYLRANEP